MCATSARLNPALCVCLSALSIDQALRWSTPPSWTLEERSPIAINLDTPLPPGAYCTMAWQLEQFLAERVERGRALLVESDAHRGSLELQV